MKIALDLRRIKNPGIGRYMKGLTEALLTGAPEHEYLLIVPPDGLEHVRADGLRASKLPSAIKYYSFREQFSLPRILRQHKVDLFHTPHFNFPWFCLCPCVITIHDVIYLACREDLPSMIGRAYYRAMMKAATRSGHKLITDSCFSRDEIRKHLNAKCDPEVIYPGIEPAFHEVADAGHVSRVKSQFGIWREYVLYTGIFMPRKNHAGLLRSFVHLLRKGADAELVIAGPLENGEAELRTLAGELGIADRVILTGFVPESDLPALYSGARVYACPSLYEGFGFTVLEAMACGVPVVCSREGSLPEVAADAAVYADARDHVQFGEALHRLFVDEGLRMALIERGRANVKRFCWSNAAQQTLRVYEQALGSTQQSWLKKRTGAWAG